MPLYTYSAIDHQGFKVSGILEAAVPHEAIAILHKKELIVVSVKEEKAKKIRAGKVKIDDLAIFSRELATMVDSGITLVQALSILGEQGENKMLAITTMSIKEDIVSGLSLHEALSKHPKIFSSLYVNMVKAGEASGFLDEILERLATYLEKTSALQRRIRMAMVYPTVVISIAVAITILLLVKVVPTFEAIFHTLGGTLPLPTRILIMVSQLLRKFILVGVGIAALAAFIFKKYVSTPKGRYRLDYRLLRLPIFGPLIRKIIIAKFTRTLAVLVKSAVPFLTALDIVAKAANNTVLEEAIQKSREAIRQGEPISEPLSKSGVFPLMVVRMIAVGEQTGQMQHMLNKIADLYEEHVDAAVTGLTSMIEPLVIGFLGIVIGGIVISLFMPIFKIVELIR